MEKYIPKYISLLKSGELYERVKLLNEKLAHCDVCPHKCFVNRLNYEHGFCGAGKNAVVTCYGKSVNRNK